jgi:hypothetical protein
LSEIPKETLVRYNLIQITFFNFFFFLSDFSKILIAGGRYGNLRSVEVLDLDRIGSGNVSDCKNLPDLPVGLVGPTGKLFNGSTPILCGSVGSEVTDRLCKCFALRENEWTDHPGKYFLYRFLKFEIIVILISFIVIKLPGYLGDN